MIVVKIEVWPMGDESKKYDMGVATISLQKVEDGYGTYEVRLGKFGSNELNKKKNPRLGTWKKATVGVHDRKKRGPWDLLYRSLRILVGKRNENI